MVRGGPAALRITLGLSVAIALSLGAGLHARKRVVSQEQRAGLVRRARVWMPPATPIEDAQLRHDPPGPGAFKDSDIVTCRFVLRDVGGNTPKFDCDDRGEVIRVRYGADNAETYTQIAATRLMSALGFPADRLYHVADVRCIGCPADPFPGLKCLRAKGSPERCFPNLDPQHASDFRDALIERQLEGQAIETETRRGWSWSELNTIASRDPASRAHVDALRLIVMFLNDWDTKHDNQRLLCLGARSDASTCRNPVAMVSDVGATFGPNKLNLERWRTSPVWSDAATCEISMRHLPYQGEGFVEVRISEAGRRFLADELRRLSQSQLVDLFEGAR